MFSLQAPYFMQKWTKHCQGKTQGTHFKTSMSLGTHTTYVSMGAALTDITMNKKYKTLFKSHVHDSQNLLMKHMT